MRLVQICLANIWVIFLYQELRVDGDEADEQDEYEDDDGHPPVHPPEDCEKKPMCDCEMCEKHSSTIAALAIIIAMQPTVNILTP